MAADLSAMLAELADLQTTAEDVARACVTEVRGEIDRTIAAGQDPYGQPWEPRKRDGGRPLRSAARAVRVTAYEDEVIIRLTGVESRHHTGAIKGRTQRRIIPTRRDLPDGMRAAVEAAVDRVWREKTGRA